MYLFKAARTVTFSPTTGFPSVTSLFRHSPQSWIMKEWIPTKLQALHLYIVLILSIHRYISKLERIVTYLDMCIGILNKDLVFKKVIQETTCIEIVTILRSCMLVLKHLYLCKDFSYTLYTLRRLQKVTTLCVYIERLPGVPGNPDDVIVQT